MTIIEVSQRGVGVLVNLGVVVPAFLAAAGILTALVMPLELQNLLDLRSYWGPDYLGHLSHR